MAQIEPLSNTKRPIPATSDGFEMPPRARNAAGKTRCVGFEIEFSGLELDAVAELVRDELGGEIREHSRFRYEICGSRLGDFTAELDWSLVEKPVWREHLLELIPEDKINGEKLTEWTGDVESLVARVAGTVVPSELISSPIALDHMAELEPIREALHRRGAKGTGASPLYGFGLHLNPEVPGTETMDLLRHLRAFFVLQDWLAKRDGLDLTRRLLPYIHPFPASYVRRVLDDAYQPDRRRLIDDYLADNATRNRPLDLLPLFADLEGESVSERLDEELVKPRPTFHYRLPSCRVDNPDWRLAEAWNGWAAVERLAGDEARLEDACSAYRDHLEATLSFFDQPWHEQVQQWL